MARKRPAGLIKRQGVWHIDKIISGQRVCQSCGTSDLKEAESFLAYLVEEKRQTTVYGVRPKRTFEEAAAAYIIYSKNKKSLKSEISKLKQILPFIGELNIDQITRATLNSWVEMRKNQGRATNTINHGLKMVRRVLNVAATELYIENTKKTWLAKAPKIKLFDVEDERDPYPINWDEQAALLAVLPAHLKDMCLFALNTGCRDQEICHLRWSWEIPIPGFDNTIFVIPKEFTKSKHDKYLVLNAIAKEVVENQRGIHEEFIFSYRGNGLYQMNNTGWQNARKSVGLPDLHVHDLRHTFATRLIDLGVDYNDVRILLGHSKKAVTDKYIHATLGRFQKAVDKLCPNAYGKYPKIALIRVPETIRSRNFHADKKKRSAK